MDILQIFESAGGIATWFDNTFPRRPPTADLNPEKVDIPVESRAKEHGQVTQKPQRIFTDEQKVKAVCIVGQPVSQIALVAQDLAIAVNGGAVNGCIGWSSAIHFLWEERQPLTLSKGLEDSPKYLSIMAATSSTSIGLNLTYGSDGQG